MLRSIRQLSQVKAQRTNQIRQFHNNVQQYGTSKKIRVMRSVSTDPFVNLATEDWIFNSVDPSQQILYLWRNEKTVRILFIYILFYFILMMNDFSESPPPPPSSSLSAIGCNWETSKSMERMSYTEDGAGWCSPRTSTFRRRCCVPGPR